MITLFEGEYIAKIDQSDFILPIKLVDLLVELKLCDSKGNSKKLISNNGISILRRKITDINFNINSSFIKSIEEDFMWSMIQKGKSKIIILYVDIRSKNTNFKFCNIIDESDIDKLDNMTNLSSLELDDISSRGTDIIQFPQSPDYILNQIVIQIDKNYYHV